MPSRNWPTSITSANRNEIRSCRVLAIATKVYCHGVTVFEAAGGAETFKTLVQRFYARVALDPVVRPLYPEEDLSSATERLTLFLIQYWGGPTTYSAQRGHP